MELEQTEFWQTQARGTNNDEYQIYLTFTEKGAYIALHQMPWAEGCKVIHRI